MVPAPFRAQPRSLVWGHRVRRYEVALPARHRSPFYASTRLAGAAATPTPISRKSPASEGCKRTGTALEDSRWPRTLQPPSQSTARAPSPRISWLQAPPRPAQEELGCARHRSWPAPPSHGCTPAAAPRAPGIRNPLRRIESIFEPALPLLFCEVRGLQPNRIAEVLVKKISGAGEPLRAGGA